jgi:hypothetical protein
VNWANSGRQFDYEALDRYHRLRNGNRAFVTETRPLETANLSDAIDRYYRALETMREYESLTLERGLVAELSSNYRCGDVNILDRLTLCLVKAGRAAEADGVVKAYFVEFPDARKRAAVRPIVARVAKALGAKVIT